MSARCAVCNRWVPVSKSGYLHKHTTIWNGEDVCIGSGDTSNLLPRRLRPEPDPRQQRVILNIGRAEVKWWTCCSTPTPGNAWSMAAMSPWPKAWTNWRLMCRKDDEMNNEQFEYLMAFIRAIESVLWVISGILIAIFISIVVFWYWKDDLMEWYEYLAIAVGVAIILKADEIVDLFKNNKKGWCDGTNLGR